MQTVTTETKEITVIRENEFEIEHGTLYLYRVERDDSRGGAIQNDRRFFVHAVEETRFDHATKVLKPDTKMRYYVWEVGETEYEPYEVIDHELQPRGTSVHPLEVSPVPDADSAATRYVFEEW